MPPVDLLQLLEAAPPGTLVIIDGNNFLYSQSPRYGCHRDADFPGPAHQEALIAHVCEVSDTRPDLFIDLWFDHPEAKIQALTERLRVMQSGGKGKDRADRAILRFLAERQADPSDPPPILLTLDKGLHKRGRRYKAWRPAALTA